MNYTVKTIDLKKGMIRKLNVFDREETEMKVSTALLAFGDDKEKFFEELKNIMCCEFRNVFKQHGDEAETVAPEITQALPNIMVDAYTALMAQWDDFTDYVWKNRDKFAKSPYGKLYADQKKKKLGAALAWYVYELNINTNTVEEHNVFEHGGFMKDCREALKKYPHDRAAFMDMVKSSLMYYYWSKFEWEILITDLFGHSDSSKHKPCEMKVDVYMQVMMNWDRFADYLWENRGKIKAFEV